MLEVRVSSSSSSYSPSCATPRLLQLCHRLTDSCFQRHNRPHVCLCFTFAVVSSQQEVKRLFFHVFVRVCVRDRWDRPELISVEPQTASWDLQAAQGQMFVHTVQRKLVVICDDACGEVYCS